MPIRPGKKGDLTGKSYRKMGQRDYADHLASLKTPFLEAPGVEVLELSGGAEKYVQSLAAEIIGKNEIFFKELKSANVTVLSTDAPLHFSLPYGELFLSRGLIAKYIKHESMLVSVLAYELVRSEKLLYPKETIVPVGFVPLERMVTLNRLGLEEKHQKTKFSWLAGSWLTGKRSVIR